MQLNEVHTEHEHATTSLKVVLLVFAIVLIGALSYLVWASNTAPDTTDNSAAVTKKTTAITTATGIADWQSYTNSSYGFNFKHPQDWIARENSDPTALAEPWKSYTFYVDYTPPGASDHFGYIGISKKTVTQLGASEYPSTTSSKSEDVTINGVKATKISYTFVGGTNVNYYIVTRGYTYSISGPWTGSDVASVEEIANLKIVDQIISTITFEK
ncbi:MAG: hypothetical protein AAB669_01070 [Patescibacteria group bacterium]